MNYSRWAVMSLFVLAVPAACADVLGIKDAQLQNGGGSGDGGSDPGGSGSGGSGAVACGMSYKTECLQTCYDTNCCEEQQDCKEDPNCAAFLDCSLQCTSGDASCYADCIEAHPDGADVMAAVGACGRDNCALCPDSQGDAAIAEYAKADCTKLQSCSPAWFSISFGTIADCIARSELANRWSYHVPGSGWTASVYMDCAKAWSAMSCADYLRGNRPPACIVPGKFALGEACNSSVECQSLVCDADQLSCGVCVDAPKQGEACIRDSCENGLTCADDNTCQQLRELGEACAEGIPCALPLICYQGICVERQSTVGAACDTASNLYCDFYKSLTCYTSEKKCVAVTDYASEGESCGVDTDGTATLCASGNCQSGSQTCAAQAEDYEACDDTNGPYCQWPSFCSNGTCQLDSDLPICNIAEEP